MKKSTLLVVFLLILLPVGCAPAQTPAAPTPVPPTEVAATPVSPTVAPEEVIELTMWDIPESEPYTQWWKDYIKQFNATHPNIHVKLEVFETEPYKAKYVAAAAAGTLADIIYQIPGPESIRVFQEGKTIALDDLLDADRWSEAAIEQCTIDGKVACMPLYYAPNMVYYNKKMLAEAGVDPDQWADPSQPTWDEFLAACETLKQAGFVPMALGNADNWPGLMWYWAFQNRYGGSEGLWASVRGENGGSYQSPSWIQAGERVQEFYKRGYLPVGFNGIGGAQKYTLWTQENGAFIYQGPWMLGHITAEAPEGFEYGFINAPSFSDGKPDAQSCVMAGIDALWISSSCKHPAAAAEFLNGFANPETQLDFALKTGNVTAVKGIEAPPERANETVWQLAATLAKAPCLIPWYDAMVLPPQVNEEQLANSQGLLIGEISPEEFAARSDEAAGR